MSQMLNISTYQFKSIEQVLLAKLRESFLAQAKAYDLKGSILLSVEGINCFLSGEIAKVHAMLDDLLWREADYEVSPTRRS